MGKALMSEINEVLLNDGGDGLQSAKLLTSCKDAVCYIQCMGKDSIRRGSGFFARLSIRGIEHLCIVTNNHVIGNRSDAVGGIARFHYEGKDPGRSVELKPDILFCTDEVLDYTIIGCDYETIQYTYGIEPIEFAAESTGTLQLGDDIFIFQHPKGLSKMFSYQKISDIEQPYLYYKADTDVGSSGSPVFRKLKLLAVHSKGSDALRYNKGTLCSEILSHLNHGTYTTPKPLCESSIFLKRKSDSNENGDGTSPSKQPRVDHTGTVASSDADSSNSPSEDDLLNLSSEIVSYWKHLGRKLKVSNVKIEAIHKDHINYDDIAEKAFAMLMSWKQQNDNCSWSDLRNALCSLRKNETARKYCSGL